MEKWNEAISNGEEFDISEVPEIISNKKFTETSNSSTQPNILHKVATASASKTLQLCVNKLVHVHLPRLRLWINGLISADDMTCLNMKPMTLSSSSSISTSLHRLPLSIRRRRKQIAEKLLDMKASVSSILASASSLGIRPESDWEHTRSVPSTTNTNQPSNAIHDGTRSRMETKSCHNKSTVSLLEPSTKGSSITKSLETEHEDLSDSHRNASSDNVYINTNPNMTIKSDKTGVSWRKLMTNATNHPYENDHRVNKNNDTDSVSTNSIMFRNGYTQQSSQKRGKTTQLNPASS